MRSSNVDSLYAYELAIYDLESPAAVAHVSARPLFIKPWKGYPIESSDAVEANNKSNDARCVEQDEESESIYLQ